MTAGSIGNRNSKIQSQRAERGSDIIEFGFVATMLVAMLLAVVVFARGYDIYQTITRAAREGARMAVLPDCASCGNSYLDPSSGVTETNSLVFENYVAPALRAANLDPGAVIDYSETVGWLDSGDTEQQCGAKISFEYPYHFGLPFLSASLQTIDISADVQMRRENQPEDATCP